MGTLKGCLAVVKDFTEEDFSALEERARAYSKDKNPSNQHFIKAAKDILATLEKDVEAIKTGIEKELNAPTTENPGKEAEAAPAQTPQVKTDNADLTKGAEQATAPKEEVTALKRRLERLVNGKTAVDIEDEANIEAAIENGNFDEAKNLIAGIESAIRDGRYRTSDLLAPPTKAIADAELRRIVSDVEKALGGSTGITILDSVKQFDPKQRAGTRAGVMSNGSVILFRDGIPSGVEGYKTVFHELFHKGLGNLIPRSEYESFMNRLYDQSADVRKLAQAYLNSPQGKGDTEGLSQRAARALAVEEVLAEMAESTKLKPSALRQLGNWFASVADRIGLKPLAQWLRSAPQAPLQQFINDALKASVNSVTSISKMGGNARYRSVSAKEASAAVAAIGSKLKYDVLGALKRGVLKASFLRDLDERFGEKIDGVGDYTKAVFRMSSAEARIQEAGEKVQIAWNKLNQRGKDRVADLMASATELDAVLEPQGKKNNDHLSAADKIKAKALQEQFNRLSEDEKETYRLARDTLAQNWQKRGELLSKTVRDVYDPLIEQEQTAGNEKKAAALARDRDANLIDINAVLASVKGDYFPMMRFGDWLVVKKSEKFEAVRTAMEKAYADLEAITTKFDTKTPDERKAIREFNKKQKEQGSDMSLEEFAPEERQQIKAARAKYQELRNQLDELKASEADYAVSAFESRSEAEAYKEKFGGDVSLKAEHEASVNPLTRSMLNKIGDSLEVTLGSGGNVQAVRDAKRAMLEIFLSTLPDRSAMKRQAKRVGVAGFSRDMQRSIAAAVLRDSFYLSRLEHADDVNEALFRAERNAKQSGVVENQEVVRELARRHAQNMVFVDTPVQDFLTQVAYIWRLGVSPAYLIVNMMQPGMVTAPMLWARHGGASRAAFAKAYADVFKLVNESLSGKGSIEGKLSQIDYTSLKDPAEVNMLTKMLEKNLLNVTLVQELARTADGKGVSRVSSLLAKPSHYVEQINRITSALAAYRLEKAKSDEAAALKYAERVLRDTHFDYSSENAPNFMKPGGFPGGKLLFQFKKYQLGMISLLVKTVARAVGNDKTLRTEARRQLVGMLVTHMAIGGALGIPAATTLLGLASVITSAFDDEEEPIDIQVELKNWAHDTLGEEAGDVLAKGLPTLLGMDFSKRVGLGDILNPMPTLRSDGKEGRELWNEILAAGAGPAIGGLGGQAFEGVSYMAKGDFIKATEQLLPKFLADLLKSYRFADEGVTTRSGNTAVDRDVLSAWDLVQQASGLAPLNITDRYEARAAVENKKQDLADIAAQHKQDWVKAKRDGDMQEAQDIWINIRDKVNPARVRNGLKPITQSDLYRFAQQRGKQEQAYSKYGANVGKNAALAQEGRFGQ